MTDATKGGTGEKPGIGAFRHLSDAVFDTRTDPVVVGPAEIAKLIEAARTAPAGRARLLLHPTVSDTLHEMVIALPGESCDHPHINFVSAKSFLALSGRFAVMPFDDDGTLREPVILSAGPWAGQRMVRLQRPVWHTIIPLDGDTVFLETILGPFRGNRFASWFPDGTVPGQRAAIVEELRAAARRAAAIAPAGC